MNLGEALSETLAALRREGWEEVEVVHKRGRSRTLDWSGSTAMTAFRQEEGFAVRAGDRRRSFFYAAAGPPRPDTAWPEADGQGLRLPAARLVPPWAPPSDLDAPLFGETEAIAFFEGLVRALDTELAGARLLLGRLDDGSSESQLLSSRDVAATVRQRVAHLHLEAVGPAAPQRSVTLTLAERDVRRFNPVALARRLADRLLVVARGASPLRDRGEFLLAPAVMIRLLEALRGLWQGPQAEAKATLVQRNGRIGCPLLHLVDNGRLPGGVFEAPVDGEGQPCREVVLVEEGLYRQPLLAWWQTLAAPSRASGCARRPGWRDLPDPGFTHFYLRPDPATSVGSLLEGVKRGYYLLDVEAAPRVEADFSRFAVPVCGFAIDGGRPTGSVAGTWLTGAVQSLLGGLLATARDLTFLPLGSGLVGSPSVLVKGLELRYPP